MDCNKEEASRAKTLAEKKMQKRDFVRAQKLLMKAQSLFSDLESFPEMLAVCDVHSAAEKKINGLENWYGILQVMHFDDDATIKKQVRKLVLLLHPDKNQFPGSDAAFELVLEASVLLADKEKRSSYDIKRRVYSGIASKQLNANSVKSYAESSVPQKGEEKIKDTTELHKPQLEVTEPGKGASKSVPDDSVSRNDQASSMSKNKRRKFVEEPIEIINVEDETDVKDNNKRRTQKTSYGGKGSSNDFLSPPIKRPRSSVGLKSEASTKKACLDVASSKRLDSGGSSTPSCVFKGKAKKNVESEECGASGEGVVMAEKINNHKANEEVNMPDPEFSNFELTTSCFAVNQVWSVYDPSDGMPRFYARIEKVLDSEFKLWITWIYPLQDNKDHSIPIACGIFQDGDSNEVDDHLIFSCQMLPLTHNNNIIIHPRKGEIWAVFRGWDISWRASSENHKRPYEYDYVEVVSNFKDEYGLGVAYLGKVEGFLSLFRRDAQHGVLQLQIPPSEMLRFSHKVPSFKMTGKEREGVPPGCFELDTAALPRDLFEVDNAKVDVGLDRERRNGKTDGPFPQASKVEVQANTSSPFPKTHVPSSCKENTFNLENQRSWDKFHFKVDQIWAIYSNEKGIPRNYAQIKGIDRRPECKLHVAPLHLCHPPELIRHPVCCGRFKLKTGIAEVLVPSSFSHQVKAVKGKKNRFEVYPGKGEIWALYRNWNAPDCADAEELEIVEVVETDEQRIQVVPLIAKVLNKSLYERSQESKAGFEDIPKTQVHRFSHQIPAFRHEGRATQFGDGECWELDPRAVWALNSKNS